MRERLGWACIGITAACGGATTDGTFDTGGSANTGGSAGVDAAAPPGACSATANFVQNIVWTFEGSTTTTGFWTFHDDSPGGQVVWPASATESPPMTIEGGGHCDSTLAFRFAGSGFNLWGAGSGNALAGFVPAADGVLDSNGLRMYVPGIFDASQFDGLSFWARGLGMGAQNTRVTISDSHTEQGAVHALPPAAGPFCTPLATNPGGSLATPTPETCANNFGVDFRVTTDWAFYVLPFSAFRQSLGSTEPQIDRAHLFVINFYMPASESFDLWLDDIGFARAATR